MLYGVLLVCERLVSFRLGCETVVWNVYRIPYLILLLCAWT